MANDSHFCYTILMHKLCLLAGIVSCATVFATGKMDGAGAVVDQESARASQLQTRHLLQEIERIRATHDTIDCQGLQPIPLYEGAPSVEDWTHFCLARARRDTASCDSIPAMLIPDVRTLCHDA